MKKLFSVIMVMAMLLSSAFAFTGTAFADTVKSEELEKAIATVKGVIEIPESFTEFNYYYDEGSDKNTLIRLNWESKEGKGYTSATVDTSGIITSYYCYMPEFDSEGLAKITKDQGQKLAEAYLKKLLPNASGTFKLKENTENGYSSEYLFNYQMYINDVPCDFINVNISINKYAGELSNYRYNGEISDITLKEYPSKDKIITEEEAGSTYISELGPDLKYMSYYDYQKSLLKIFPVYGVKNNQKAIDAKTGKVILLYDKYIGYGAGARKESAAMDKSVENAGGVQFTEEELKEIDKTKNLISKEEADKAAKNLTPIPGSLQLKSSALRKDRGPSEKYVWSLGYDSKSATIDAEDGSLISFDSFKVTDDKDKRDIGKEKAKTIADGYLAKVFSESKEQVKWSNQDDSRDYGSSYNFAYTRQVNDISVESNTIYISVDKATGEIASYRKTWYEDAKFPELAGAMEKDVAFEKIAKLGDFGLVYKKDSEGKVSLVYDLRKGSDFTVDSHSGVRLDYNGQVYREVKDYTDISGNWAEKIINELKSNGFYLEGDKFMPKADTTQLEFFKYLYSPQQRHYPSDDAFYDMLVGNKIITKEEINPKGHITRQEAAKFSARYMGVDKLAREYSVFKNIYTDKISNEYLGYASAAYAMGIMKGDSKGRFNGTQTLTHAETASVIYNLLNKSV